LKLEARASFAAHWGALKRTFEQEAPALIEDFFRDSAAADLALIETLVLDGKCARGGLVMLVCEALGGPELMVDARFVNGRERIKHRPEMTEEIEKRNAALAQENERTREHIQRLSDNPAEQELEIRQRLKLVHPGEKVYILNNR